MRAIILLALLGSAFAVPKTINRIVGGTDTDIETYPFMANMRFGFFGVAFSQACGGALITPLSVLSAAHCFVGDPASWWRVRLGTSFRNSGGTEYNVARIINHERYDVTPLDNDVAVIILGSPATLSNTVGTAYIAGPNYQLADGTPITAMGWGTTTFQGSPSERLQEVTFDIINQELCAERYAHLKTQPGFQSWPDVTDGMVCAGILDVGGKDACQGDSGGPVVHNGNVIYGITSWGYQCALPHYPGVLARVNHYSDWIVANSQ